MDTLRILGPLVCAHMCVCVRVRVRVGVCACVWQESVEDAVHVDLNPKPDTLETCSEMLSWSLSAKQCSGQ